MLVAASPRALADRCAPTARVTGDDAAATAVQTELRRLGVTLGEATTDCPGVDAQVRADGRGGFEVTMRDGDRTDERDLGAPAVAAAWIDAWVRDDLDWRADAAPGATPPAPAKQVAQLSEPADGPPDRVTHASDAASSSSLLSRASFAAGYASQWTGDGAAWTGFSASGCGRSGAWCFGGRAQYASQDFSTGQTGVARNDTSILATVAYALPLGTLALVPEIGLGAGRMSSSRDEACGPSQPGDPDHPPMPMRCADGGGTYVGDDLHAVTYTPRGELAIRVEVPLFAHVWLDGVASATAAPFGHGDAFASMKSPPPGSGITPQQLALPGEPVAAFQLGVGLRVGGL